MTVVGIHASHEQVHPAALLRAVGAEDPGFGHRVLPEQGGRR
jgi:hypothetical protein